MFGGMEASQSDQSELLESLRAHFNSGQTRSRAARLEALNQLERLVRENTEAICRALFEDLRKPKQEAVISEIAVTLGEIAVAKKNLRRWMRPESKGTPLALWPSRSRVYHDPLGVVLVIGPWNYPFQLVLAPLVASIAAGNCTALKPSELTPKVSQLIAQLVGRYFARDYVRVVEGGVPETTALLALQFDHIFFTGSTQVGRIVLQAAAKNLVPVTLELGGKSPVIVCADADLDLAARRIVWGKFYNAGQTCLAPDYLYAHESVAAELIGKITQGIRAQFGDRPKESNDLARIVSEPHCRRLEGLVDRDKVIAGGEVDLASRYVAPTLMRGVTWEDKVMGQEIFGPLLPILTFSNLSDLIASLNSRPKPLAAYLFSRSRTQQDAFLEQLHFGGGCINDTLLHFSHPDLPFGGVGESGLGSYHGEAGFKRLSHAKSVLHRSGAFDFSARYPPYSAGKLKFLRRIFGA
jgi:aldehyde dehydrogenase (NAD+)